MLEPLNLEKLKKIKDQTKELEKKLLEKLDMYQKNLQMIDDVLGNKVEADHNGKELPN